MPIHSEIRAQELRKLAQSMAQQFKITNPLDVQALESQLLARYANGNILVSQYNSSNLASSSKFRGDVRNVLVDLIASFGHLKSIYNSYLAIEGSMRAIVDDYSYRLTRIVSQLTNSDKDNIRFIQGPDLLANTEYTNVTMSSDIIRLPKDRIPTQDLTNMDITTTFYPAVDLNNGVLLSTNGDVQSVLKSGPGTATWSIDMYTKSIPAYPLYVSTLESITDTAADLYSVTGTVARIEFQNSDTTITPKEMELKFQQPVRVLSVLSSNSLSSTLAIHKDSRGVLVGTILPKKDITVSLPDSAVQRIVVYLQVMHFTDRKPYASILADQYLEQDVYVGAMQDPNGFSNAAEQPDYYHYELGLYNVKFLKTPADTSSGTLTTPKFYSYNGALESSSIVVYGSGVPDPVVTYYQPNGSVTDIDSSSSVTQVVETIEDSTTTVQLEHFPYVDNDNELSVNIVTVTGDEIDAEPYRVMPLTPGELPQFSPDNSLECFVLGSLIVFKDAIALDPTQTLAITYYVKAVAVSYTLTFTDYDSWVQAYMVNLHDHVQ